MTVKIRVEYYDCKPWCHGRTGTLVGYYNKPERGALVRFDGHPQCPHKGGVDPTRCFFEDKNAVLEVIGDD